MGNKIQGTKYTGDTRVFLLQPTRPGLVEIEG